MKSVLYRGFLTTCFFLFGFISFSQKNAPIKDPAELEREKKVLVEIYPHLFTADEIKDVRKIDDKHSIVYHTRNGVNFETVINSSSKDMLIVATCEEIPVAALPAVVKANVEQEAGDSPEITKAFLVTTPYDAEFYRVDIRMQKEEAGVIESLFFDPMGNTLKSPY